MFQGDIRAASGEFTPPTVIQSDDVVDTIATGILPPEDHGAFVRVKVVSAQPGRPAKVLASYLLTKPNLCDAIVTAARVMLARGFRRLRH